MEARAYAKINLSLEVLGRRDDGYHEVVTVLHTVGLWDTLGLAPALALSFTCSDPALDGEDNLVLRAARLLQQATGARQGAAITLAKGVPVAAGLGGGSSDAAATLKALNRLWGMGLSLEALAELAIALGADVPFFLRGGCALGRGRGEVLTPLPPLVGRWAVIVCPPGGSADKTARLYSLLSEEEFTSGDITQGLATGLLEGKLGPAYGYNTFERVAPQAFLEHEREVRAFRQAGAPSVHLTGAGPSLYTVLPSERRAQEIARALRGSGRPVYLAELVASPDG